MTDNNFSIKGIIDLEQIQKLAERFCIATNVFAYALDADGRQLTKLSGSKEDCDKIWNYLNENQIKEFLMMKGKAPKAVCPVRFLRKEYL